MSLPAGIGTHEMPREMPNSAAEFLERQQRTKQRVAEVQRRTQAAKAELAEAATTQTSPDRTVTLTVNPGGRLSALTFGPDATKKTPAQLSATVLDTYRKACRAAVSRTIQVMSEFTGGDESALATLRQNLPAEVTATDDGSDR